MANTDRVILVLGSGPIQIGQAGEFDYAGTQALKALKEEGIRTILLNPNVATVQTSEGYADVVHLLPITPAFAASILKQERCNGILPGFGGQTAVECGLALDSDGTLERLGVELLGTPASGIRQAEDRQLFREQLQRLALPAPRSQAAFSVAEAHEAARKLGFPVILRAAYALGGKGAGIVSDERQLKNAAQRAFAGASQVLVEEGLVGWKEIELEILRDQADNVLAVCSMEGVDPLGIHTGDSIVVAPAQTLTDEEFQDLRDAAIRLARHLGLVGECNVQFAVDPCSREFRVIEVNPRLSRSSALASKATGYPLAFVAAKLALGKTLPQLENPLTRRTAFLEPALDYIVCKVPRWDLGRFEGADPTLGPEMKSVGEVMAVGRSFPEALQKALRMIEVGADGFDPCGCELPGTEGLLEPPTPARIFAIARAMAEGRELEEIARITGIDRFFLGEMSRIAVMRCVLSQGRPTSRDEEHACLLAAKRLGFSDAAIGAAWGEPEDAIRERRRQSGIRPSLAPLDSLAGEYPTSANGWYLSYMAESQDPPPIPPGAILVLGSGCYRIGSSVEFDWACTSALAAAKEHGCSTMVLNCNPETASTDYDSADHVLFEEPSREVILEVVAMTSPAGVIVSMGGQTPNTLAIALASAGVPVLGTLPEAIAKAESRATFSRLCTELGLSQSAWTSLESGVEEDLGKAVERIGGFPVLVRPSYVLGGTAMRVAWDMPQLKRGIRAATACFGSQAVVMTSFKVLARELEFDAVAWHGEIVLWAICEHVEDAGVHSGDATFLLPPQDLAADTLEEIRAIAARVATALDVTGPLNLQFLVSQGRVLILECNLRASRSLPFVSKVLGVNFAAAATRLQLGCRPEEVPRGHDPLRLEVVGAKAPQFSYRRMRGVDPLPGVVMASTGEAAAIARDADEAILLAMLGAGFKIPERGILLVPGQSSDWAEAWCEAVHLLNQRGLVLYVVGKSNLAREIPVCRALGTDEEAIEALNTGAIDLVACHIVPRVGPSTARYQIRRAAIDLEIPVLSNPRLIQRLFRAISRMEGQTAWPISHQR